MGKHFVNEYEDTLHWCCSGSDAAVTHRDVRATTSVFTNDHTSRVGVSITLMEHILIPSFFVCVVGRQGHANFATKAIGSKIFFYSRY